MTAFSARRRFGAALVAFTLAAAMAGAIGAPDASFEPAFALFSAANAGDSSAVEKAADAFGALLKAEPGNPVLLAYHGAAVAMQATTTMLPWKKMNDAEDGLAQIDKALAMLTPAQDAVVQHGTPGSLEVKFVAANTFLAVPAFMNRAARGSKLLAEVLASPLLDGAALPFRGAVWMRAAKLATSEKRNADARTYLQLVVDRGAPQAAQARAQLKEIA